MQAKLLFAILLCFLLLAVVGVAQQRTPLEQIRVNQSKKSILERWYGEQTGHVVANALKDTNFRAVLGISDEQRLRIQELEQDMRHGLKNPELIKISEEMKEVQTAMGPNFQNADEETIKKFTDLQDRWQAETNMSDTIDRAIAQTLTPEQAKKIKEAQLARLLETSVVSTNIFDVFDLTDVQKQQMAAVKKKLEAEFDEQLEKLAIAEAKDQAYINAETEAEIKRQGLVGSLSSDVIVPISDKVIKEYPDFWKTQNEIRTQGEQFSSQFKTRMFDVLTDEQWVRLQKLIDDPPEHAKAFYNAVRPKNAVWTPGPNSWQPGDPIPEEYRQQRNTRGNFPRRATAQENE
jgi:Spy/CpxP family protein refolding chaperone